MKNQEFSDDKLKELLKNSSSAQPFKVPDGYFEELSEKTMNSIKAISDFETQPTSQPFVVPANYFDELPSVINEKILTKSSKVISIRESFFTPIKTTIVSLSVAAAIAFGFFYFNHSEKIENNNTCTVEEISESTYLQSISDDDLLDYLASQDVKNTTDEYDQYLLDNDIDLSQLEKDL